MGIKSKIVYKLHHETGLPVFFCSCQSADFFLFYEYVIIMFAVTVWKVVTEGMISEEVYERKRILVVCAGCGADGSGLC